MPSTRAITAIDAANCSQYPVRPSGPVAEEPRQVVGAVAEVHGVVVAEAAAGAEPVLQRDRLLEAGRLLAVTSVARLRTTSRAARRAAPGRRVVDHAGTPSAAAASSSPSRSSSTRRIEYSSPAVSRSLSPRRKSIVSGSKRQSPSATTRVTGAIVGSHADLNSSVTDDVVPVGPTEHAAVHPVQRRHRPVGPVGGRDLRSPGLPLVLGEDGEHRDPQVRRVRVAVRTRTSGMSSPRVRLRCRSTEGFSTVISGRRRGPRPKSNSVTGRGRDRPRGTARPPRWPRRRSAPALVRTAPVRDRRTATRPVSGSRRSGRPQRATCSFSWM